MNKVCKDHEQCNKCNKYHPHNIEEENYIEMSVLFKMLSDPTRLKILSVLLDDELCVSAICEILGISQSAVSHQLAKLRANKVIKVRSEGTNKFYSLDDKHIKELFECGFEHIKE